MTKRKKAFKKGKEKNADHFAIDTDKDNEKINEMNVKTNWRFKNNKN